MRYYGVTVVGPVVMFRYEGPPNKHIYSLPLSQSTSVSGDNPNLLYRYRTRPDLLYYCNDSGPLTVTECLSNSELVGITFQGGNLYNPEELFGNNTVRLESGNTIPIVTPIHTTYNSNVKIVDANVINVSGSYTLPVNTYAAIVEGTVTVSNTTADSNTDLFVIGSSEQEREITGDGRLVTFKLQATGTP